MNLFLRRARLPLSVMTMGVASTAAPSAAQPGEEPKGNDKATPSIVMERSALVPGETASMAVTFDIEPGWHLYWRNEGDSGMPPQVIFEAPDALSIGEPRWPVPHRHVTGDILLDYIFEDRLTLIYPVTLSPDAEPGSHVTIDARIDWLVCEEYCLPGNTTLHEKLPVARTASRGEHAELFEQARKRHPKRVEKPEAAGIRTQWRGTELIVRVDGAKELTFYPYESDRLVFPENMIEHGTVEGERLALRYPSEVMGVARVKGDLEIVRAGEERELITLDIASPGSGGDGAGARPERNEGA